MPAEVTQLGITVQNGHRTISAMWKLASDVQQISTRENKQTTLADE